MTAAANDDIICFCTAANSDAIGAADNDDADSDANANEIGRVADDFENGTAADACEIAAAEFISNEINEQNKNGMTLVHLTKMIAIY